MEEGIIAYNPPLETNILNWQVSHIDCDAIFTGRDMRKAKIYFYAKDKSYNDALYRYMRKYHADKKIMLGLSEEEIWHVD